MGTTMETKREVFGKLKDASNWKNPIDKTVTLSEEERPVVEAAVAWFTGSEATVEDLGGGNYHVKADGYYVAVGA